MGISGFRSWRRSRKAERGGANPQQVSCSVFRRAVAIEQTMPDDAELLRRYAATRDQEAFAELVRRQVDGVFSAALRRVGGDVQFAEDVAQQVFAALARKAAVVAKHPFLGAWLYTTT